MPDLTHEILRFPPHDPGPEPVHIGVLYPNTYEVAISSLGFQTIHLLAHSHPGFVTHRIVLENSTGKNYPSRTLEEILEIKSLAAILVSCSFEPDYLHLARMLNAAGIPVLRKNRNALPLVIVGGIAPTANPEPLALVADAISVGNGEITLPAILDDFAESFRLLRGARFREGRAQVYERWDRHPGVYVPALWQDDKGNFRNPEKKHLVQAAVDDPNNYPSYTPIISPDGVYGAKNLIGISAGCPSGCRFCLLSYVFPEGPERTYENILENALKFTPAEASVGLVSSRVSDHSRIVDVINGLSGMGYGVSVSSLKVSSTSRELLEALARAGTKTATFAPEHGSAAIRELVCKAYSYDEVRQRVEWSLDAGINRVKLYFLTGFEEETDGDIDATSDFIGSLVQDVGLASRRPDTRFIIGLAPFVPKAGTPFQRRKMESEKVLKSKMKRVTDALKNLPRVDTETESPRSAVIQGALSVGDRSLGKYLDLISHTKGPFPAAWEKAVSELGDSPVRRVLDGCPAGENLPWSFIKRPKLVEK